MGNSVSGGDVLRMVGMIVAIVLWMVVPIVWTVARILRPVDLAARSRNLPFRFSMGDFLCLFWLVQLPLAFVFQMRDNGRGNDEADQFYWILTAAVWGIAPLAWFTVARALSKAGVNAGMHRMIFLGAVLPTVYYGLFPFIGFSIRGTVELLTNGIAGVLTKGYLLTLWLVLLFSLVACGFYSPWLMRNVSLTEFDEIDGDRLEPT